MFLLALFFVVNSLDLDVFLNILLLSWSHYFASKFDMNSSIGAAVVLQCLERWDSTMGIIFFNI